MIVRTEDKKLQWIGIVLGLLGVIWLSLLIAPAMSGGLPDMLKNLSAVFSSPFDLHWCDASPKWLAILCGAYVIAILCYETNKPKYRRREEHGSAEWGDAKTICKKYRQEPREMNKILTQASDRSLTSSTIFSNIRICL